MLIKSNFKQMANYADLNTTDSRYIDTEIDSIVIRRKIATKTGGATLTVNPSSYPDKIIPAGHLVIYNSSTGVYAPMPLTTSGGALVLDSLPSNYAYYGIVISSTPAAQPFCGVLINGVVNYKAMKYDITSILSAVKSALPHIQFITD